MGSLVVPAGANGGLGGEVIGEVTQNPPSLEI